MRRTVCLAAVVMATLVAPQPRLDAQKPSQLFLNVTAPDGYPVENLETDEVHVTADGVECTILSLERINWPIKVQVLVDNAKLNTTPITSLRAGLKAFFATIPDGIEISMYPTSGSPREIVRPTTDRRKLIDGIALIGPDGGAGMFFDALSQAASRIDQDESPHFPVIVMVASDFGHGNAMDKAYRSLQDTVLKRAVTVHIIMMAGDIGYTRGGGQQTEIGLAMTKLSGGRYEAINSLPRLITLLPELGQRIAESHERQSHQYRVTYERPANAKAEARIEAFTARAGTPFLSIDGHLP